MSRILYGDIPVLKRDDRLEVASGILWSTHISPVRGGL